MHTSKNITARKSTTPSLRPRICSAMILAAGLTTQVYGAAISYTTAGGTYSQNFDTLPTTLTGGTQLSNTTAGSVYELTGTLNSVPAGVSGSFGTGTEGWFFSRIAAESGTTNYAPIVRTSTTFPTPASYGSVYSLSDSTLNPGDKALGMAGATSALHAIGAEFTNTTGSTLNKFTISFDMEEWRQYDDFRLFHWRYQYPHGNFHRSDRAEHGLDQSPPDP